MDFVVFLSNSFQTVRTPKKILLIYFWLLSNQTGGATLTSNSIKIIFYFLQFI